MCTRPSRVVRLGAVALFIGALALAFGIGVRSATTWSPGDVFVGMDNEFLGDPSGEITGVPTPSQYPFFDSAMTPKGVVTLPDPASYTTGCAIDPTVPDGDLYSTGFWDRKVTRISSSFPHSVVGTPFDLSADIGLPAGDPCWQSNPDDPNTCAGAAVFPVFARDGTFYVGTAYGQAKVLHYDKSGLKLGEYDVDTSGIRGPEYLDLGADQRTLYYTGLDDNAITPPVIHQYDLQTRTQLPSIPLTEVGGTPLSTHVFAFRLLPPGDGTGGFIVATDLHVYQVDASGQAVRDFIATPDFRRQMGDDDFTLFIDANVSNDGRYLLSAAYAQTDYLVDGNGDPLIDADGVALQQVVVPTKLFKFHIATGTLQGATDIGSVGDRRTANTLCIKREYIASVEQPNCQAEPTDYRCSPPPDCSLPGSEDNPFCAVPGTPTISYPNPDGSTLLTGQAGNSVNLQVLAALFPGDGETPASRGPLGYAASPLPGGLSIDPNTGLITGTVTSNGSVNVLVTVTDLSNGRTASTHFTWQLANMAPLIAAIANQVSPHGVAIAQVNLLAIDADSSDVVTFSAAPGFPLPAGLTIQSTGSRTARIVGTPILPSGYPCPGGICGDLPITILAIDVNRSPLAASQTTSFTWRITNQTPSAPVLVSPPASLNIHIGSLVNLNVTSSDPNGDPVNYSLQITPPSPEVIPALIVDPSGHISGGLPVLGTYLVTVVAADSHGGISSKLLTLNVTNNLPPRCDLATASPSVLWPPNHKFVPINLNVTDPDGDALKIKITRILQDEPTVPAGHYDGDWCDGHHHVDHDDWDDWSDWGRGRTSIDGLILPIPVVLPGQPVLSSKASVRAEREGEGDGRIYDIRFTATDPTGATCSGAVLVGVPHDRSPNHPAVDSGVRYDSLVPGGPPLRGPEFNKPPTYDNPGNQSTGVGKSVSLRTKATDVNLDPLNYSALGLPPGLTMNATSGKITGSPTTAGTYSVRLKASDPFGGSGSAAFTWVVVANRPPVAAIDSVMISKGSSTVSISVLANDSDPDGDSLTLVSVQGAHSGTATVSGSKVNYKPSSSFIGIDQFTYTVSDGRGATATGTIRVEVVNHKNDDRCDHDRRRSGHYDGDRCEHDRYSHSHH